MYPEHLYSSPPPIQVAEGVLPGTTPHLLGRGPAFQSTHNIARGCGQQWVLSLSSGGRAGIVALCFTEQGSMSGHAYGGNPKVLGLHGEVFRIGFELLIYKIMF